MRTPLFSSSFDHDEGAERRVITTMQRSNWTQHQPPPSRDGAESSSSFSLQRGLVRLSVMDHITGQRHIGVAPCQAVFSPSRWRIEAEISVCGARSEEERRADGGAAEATADDGWWPVELRPADVVACHLRVDFMSLATGGRAGARCIIANRHGSHHGHCVPLGVATTTVDSAKAHDDDRQPEMVVAAADIDLVVTPAVSSFIHVTLWGVSRPSEGRGIALSVRDMGTGQGPQHESRVPRSATPLASWTSPPIVWTPLDPVALLRQRATETLLAPPAAFWPSYAIE